MRIGLNLLFLIPGAVGGTETYAVSLVNALASIDRVNEYFLFLNRESAELELHEAPNFHRIVCNVHATNRAARYAWEQFVLPFQIRRNDLDLVHSLGYVGPVLTSCPSIVTIPDLNYIRLNDSIPAGRRRVLKFFSLQAARRSVRVITISHFSKAELVRFTDVSPDKITVTHLGAGWVEEKDKPPRSDATVGRHHLPGQYIVAFGGGSPHKNIGRLVAAFRQIAREYPHSLVILGHVPPNVDLRCLAREAGLSTRVVALGYLPREHIRPVLAGADLFVLPSLYEGFGLPVLEAQKSSVAVACAAAGSLPEVAGEGAEFFDPRSVDDMASVIGRCLSDPRLRASLRQRGARNLERFSWEKTAKGTLAVYHMVHDRL